MWAIYGIMRMSFRIRHIVGDVMIFYKIAIIFSSLCGVVCFGMENEDKFAIQQEYAELLVPVEAKIKENLTNERAIIHTALDKIAQQIAHIEKQRDAGDMSKELREAKSSLLLSESKIKQDLQNKNRKLNNIAGYIVVS
jgi:hypothetical protein